MKIAIAAAFLVAFVAAAEIKKPKLPGKIIAVAPTCQVSDWSVWGECKSSKPCFSDTNGFSYQLKPTQEDVGQVLMSILKQEKSRQWKLHQEEKAAGKIPTHKSIRKASVPCTNGMSGVFPCRNIDMLSFLDFDDLGYVPIDSDSNVKANDIWGWTDSETNDEYAIVCLSGGSSFVRVTDPVNPVVLGFLYTATVASNWRDMKVVNDHAYIVSEASGHGMQVYDLRQLRGQTEFKVLEATYHYKEVGNSHNIVANVDSNTVFIVGATTGSEYPNKCSGGLHMVDVSEPAVPKFAGCFSQDGYTHDAQCVIYKGPDASFFDREICFNFNENTLTIVDVTSKTNPILISKKGYTGVGYTHQGWLTEDMSTILLDDELDERSSPSDKRTRTYIWDVSSLTNPELKRTFYSSETSIDHNLYIKGDLAYQSNYEAGLRITHIDQAEYNLQEVAFFDVLETRTTPNFFGTWSNYPYYANGMVAVTSIDYGLFMVMPDYDAINSEIRSKKAVGYQERNRSITKKNRNASCPNLVETRICKPTIC